MSIAAVAIEGIPNTVALYRNNRFIGQSSLVADRLSIMVVGVVFSEAEQEEVADACRTEFKLDSDHPFKFHQ